MPYQSSYKGEFPPKKAEKDPNCKPKDQYKDNGLKLKGSTEYNGEYVGKHVDTHCSWNKMDV